MKMGKIKLSDGVIERHIEIAPDGMARSILTQPTRQMILERNAELRRNPGALRKLDSMGQMMTVPKVDFEIFRKLWIRHHPGGKDIEFNQALTKWALSHPEYGTGH
jgi:hypothetical protein